MDSELYAVTVCVLIRRGNTWLLVLRAPGVAYAPNMIGMIGGHVDVTGPEAGVLEATARREVAEEVGLDLSQVPLTYLESEFFITSGGERQITVTFTAPAPPGDEAYVNAPAELAEVGWWTLDDLEADPRCPPWLPDLLRRAGAR
ncbi:MAG TPA: NUDIX domain-containing protein [Propionibacteriaceae bacterium]|nr:NUDIX domain-containing protein [Propionibacteriaceae bacterium]